MVTDRKAPEHAQNHVEPQHDVRAQNHVEPQQVVHAEIHVEPQQDVHAEIPAEPQQVVHAEPQQVVHAEIHAEPQQVVHAEIHAEPQQVVHAEIHAEPAVGIRGMTVPTKPCVVDAQKNAEQQLIIHDEIQIHAEPRLVHIKKKAAAQSVEIHGEPTAQAQVDSEPHVPNNAEPQLVKNLVHVQPDAILPIPDASHQRAQVRKRRKIAAEILRVDRGKTAHVSRYSYILKNVQAT